LNNLYTNNRSLINLIQSGMQLIFLKYWLKAKNILKYSEEVENLLYWKSQSFILRFANGKNGGIWFLASRLRIIEYVLVPLSQLARRIKRHSTIIANKRSWELFDGLWQPFHAHQPFGSKLICILRETAGSLCICIHSQEIPWRIWVRLCFRGAQWHSLPLPQPTLTATSFFYLMSISKDPRGDTFD